jgi:hypothetical protein
LLLALALACAGTQRPATGKPRQAEAVALVWHLYGRTDPPPAVRWMQGVDLDCVSAAGHLGMLYGGLCMAGMSVPGTVLVVWHPGESFSATALAHELLHERLQRDTGDSDPGHAGPGWRAGGELELAVAALAAAGM